MALLESGFTVKFKEEEIKEKIVNYVRLEMSGMDAYAVLDYPATSQLMVFVNSGVQAIIKKGNTRGHFIEPFDDIETISEIWLYDGNNVIQESTVEVEDDTYIYRIKR